MLTSLPWSVDQVAVTLVRSGISKDDVRILQSQDVDGETLLFVSDSSLQRMGIPTFGRRVKLLKTIQGLIDLEAERRGMMPPNLLGLESSQQQQQQPTSDTRDPYASNLPRGASLTDPFLRSRTIPSSLPNFETTMSDRFNGDTDLLDPAHLQPSIGPLSSTSSSSSTAPSSSLSPLNNPPTYSSTNAPRTRDFGVSQTLRDSSDDTDGTGFGERRTFNFKVSQTIRDANAQAFLRTTAKSELARSNLLAGDRTDVDRNREDEEEAAGDDDAYDSDIDRAFHHPRLSSQVATYDPRLPSETADPFEVHDPTRTRIHPWLGSIVPPSRNPSSQVTSEPPSRHLQLEWVHGYRAFDSRSNLVYNAQGDIIYPVAGLCVVYSPRLRRQRHFFGHDDDVRCLTQHPLDKNLLASGQNGGIKDGQRLPPSICVWDSSSSDLSRSYTLKCTLTDKAIRTLAFSGGEGRYLATVSDDEHYSLKIWDWKKRMLMTAAKSDTRDHPIFMVRGNPKDDAEFVTVGKNHVLFWYFDGHVLKNRRGVIGGLGGTSSSSSSSSKVANVTMPSFYSITFSEKGYACLGCENGSIYVFVNGKAARTFSGVHRGKILSLEWYNGGFVSGGSDGKVHVLDRKMDVVKSFQFSNKVTSVSIGGPHGDDALLVGTQGSDVFEIPDFFSQTIEGDERLEAVTRGHSDGELWALAVAGDGKHYVTAGEDNTLCLWNLTTHRLLKRGILSDRRGHTLSVRHLRRSGTSSTHPMNQCARSIAISPNGSEIIVGTNEGELIVFDTRTFSRKLSIPLSSYKKDLRSAIDGRPSTGAGGGGGVRSWKGSSSRQHWISTIQFSPSGHALAVGTYGCIVVLLDVTDGYKIRSILERSNTPITALDWSIDGTLLQVNDASFDLLHYHVDEQDLKHVTPITNASSVRDVQWFTNTCTLSWPTSGVTQPHHQGQFVNTADAAPSRTLIATGDDSGHVNLFRYPALHGSQPLIYSGHSAHCTNVRFTPDERYLITTGGHDLAIFEWAVI